MSKNAIALLDKVLCQVKNTITPDLRAEIEAEIEKSKSQTFKLDARLLELYKSPFRFDRFGYVWDGKGEMVADNHFKDDQTLRVRGWGRISYLPNAEEVQDLMGESIAEALTQLWSLNKPE